MFVSAGVQGGLGREAKRGDKGNSARRSQAAGCTLGGEEVGKRGGFSVIRAAGRWSGPGSTSDQVIREASSFHIQAEQPEYLDFS